MNDGNNRVLVLADDFTGANDAGVSLAEAGMSVEVAFTAGQPSTARALILNSDSRAMTAAAAADKVAALLRGAATFVPHWQVKKIDSTLRGNPGGELEAMMAAQGCRMAVVAPAYPAAGRHTRDGRCYVHGVPLDQTEFASDPKTPVSRAEISEIIAMQSRLPCLTLNAGQLPAALATAGEEKRVLIVDAWEDSHLDQVIDAVAPHARETLLVGSAGLCEALARRLRRSEQGPLLAVVGSMSEMAQRQVAALQVHSRVRVIEIDVEQAFSGSPKEEASRIAGALREGQHCVVTTRPNHAVRKGLKPGAVNAASAAPPTGSTSAPGLPTSRRRRWRSLPLARCIFPAAMWPSPSRTRSAPQGFRSAAGWRSAFHTGIFSAAAGRGR